MRSSAEETTHLTADPSLSMRMVVGPALWEIPARELCISLLTVTEKVAVRSAAGALLSRSSPKSPPTADRWQAEGGARLWRSHSRGSRGFISEPSLAHGCWKRFPYAGEAHTRRS